MGTVIGFDWPTLLRVAAIEGVDERIMTTFLPYIERGMVAAFRKKQDDDGKK